ncbi:hypothetical protein FS837_006821 [Tulasnella sp. UAMH 9824]|nr:hypothetical protein FS837_006821 [Tulasnella sp. UAMH 9824]
MLPNRGPWPTLPPQTLQNSYYYPGGFHTSGTSAPPSAPHPPDLTSSSVTPSTPQGSGPTSSPVTTPLTANAREFVPSGMAGPTPLTPSPSFPLFKKSTGIRISNPNTGEVVVLRPPDTANAARAAAVQRPTRPENPNAIRIFNPRTGEAVVLPPPNLAHAAGAAGVQQPIHQRPLTKKERKMKAKLEAEAKRKAEVEAMMRRRQDDQEKKAQNEAEEAEQLRKGEEERSERPGEARIRKLDEEILKREENIRRLVEEIRKGEEELRKQAGELEGGTYKEREVAQANESVPAGMATSTPVAASLGLHLPKQSTAIEISNLNTANAVVLPLPDPANAAGPASVQPPTQAELPLTKKEIKRLARLEAAEKEKGDADAKVRLWLEGKEKTKKEVEDAKRLRVAEEAEKKREEEEVRTLEEELKKLQEEGRKEEDELKRREEERRKAEEALRRLEEEHRIQRDKQERARKEREESETKGDAEREQKHELSDLEELGAEPGEKVDQINDYSTTLSGSGQTHKFGPAFAPYAITSTELRTPPHEHDSSVTRGRLHGQDAQQWHSEDLEVEQENLEETVAEVENHHTLSAISYLSKQMDMLLQEMKELRNEVRELREESKGGDRRARSKVPPQAASLQRESSVPKIARTATAINQYFIMKKGELDFSLGDVITILDAPQDTPRGWMYGEINVTRRGFFPSSYVKLEE